jgi:hypothetical protein
MTATTSQLERAVQRQFGMLTLQFLLGMAVNLIGLPDETQGFAKLSTSILLLLHVLVAVGLIVNAVLIVRYAKPNADAQRFARLSGAAVGLATVGGILTLSVPGANWWSYLMALAFIAAFGLYGRLFSLAGSANL